MSIDIDISLYLYRYIYISISSCVCVYMCVGVSMRLYRYRYIYICIYLSIDVYGRVRWFFLPAGPLHCRLQKGAYHIYIYIHLSIYLYLSIYLLMYVCIWPSSTALFFRPVPSTADFKRVRVVCKRCYICICASISIYGSTCLYRYIYTSISL